MGMIILFFVTLFKNFCLHELLNYYNHVFKKYLQVLELDLKFAAIWKIKFKYLKVGEMFLKVFGFSSSTSILMCEHSNLMLWLMEFVFITKIILNPLKNDVIIWDTFGVFYEVQMIWHKLIWKARRRLEMPMKKTKCFIFLNARGRF
jgi:hypothetical protein